MLKVPGAVFRTGLSGKRADHFVWIHKRNPFRMCSGRLSCFEYSTQCSQNKTPGGGRGRGDEVNGTEQQPGADAPDDDGGFFKEQGKGCLAL